MISVTDELQVVAAAVVVAVVAAAVVVAVVAVVVVVVVVIFDVSVEPISLQCCGWPWVGTIASLSRPEE